MIEDVIGQYDTYNTKGYPYELIVGNFIDQPIPCDYYNLLNDNYDDGTNIPGNPVDDNIPEKEVVEYSVMTNDEDINYDIIFDHFDSLVSVIDPLQI